MSDRRLTDPFHPELSDATLTALGRAAWASIRFANLAERLCSAAVPSVRTQQLGARLTRCTAKLTNATGVRRQVVEWLPGASTLWERRNDLLHGVSTLMGDENGNLSSSPVLLRPKSGGTIEPTHDAFDQFANDAQALIEEAVRLDLLLAVERSGLPTPDIASGSGGTVQPATQVGTPLIVEPVEDTHAFVS